ncbi:DUF2220 domain-containing protein [Dethiobacter alkaliphilus]|uniref:DUF2220 domain-containing protein n=1 Tax=Dethiobacter alkaliphilus TaxID=427926 RepID=UPI002227BC99|nr:DUF2220 domain-containing protein [Dethiobacter alkaliphilus]MCW3490209.1 DUF2220 domain-containing protein [Dethiobacter alkaliphilus]
MELTSLQKKILHKLIDKYEGRRDYAAREKSTRRTMLSVDKKQFPDYFHISDSSFRLQLNHEMQELETKGLVILEWQKFNRGHTLQRIILHEDALVEAYRLLNRQSRRDEYASLAALFTHWREKSHDALAPFFTELLQKVHELAPLPARIKLDKQDYHDLFTGLNAFFAERDQEVLKRQLSVSLYNNSKRWEELEKSILWVVRNYCLQEEAELDDADILSERNIIPNPIHINISGPMVFSTPRGRVDISAFYPDIGLPPSMIREMNIEACNAQAIVTIENLSSFYQYVYEGPPDHLAIYLGGFHNRPRRLILTKLWEFFQLKSSAPPLFYHWGDMDLGGFRIWNHLCQKTGIPVQPLLMDKETYLTCLSQGQPMEESYAKKLAELLAISAYEPFYSLIRLMLKKGKRVEQEAVTLGF